MLKGVRKASLLLIIMTVITGLIYPVVITGLAQAFFKNQANGSIIYKNNQEIGSGLIGQSFSSDQYFNSRPSMAGSNGYDATASSGSNLGPTNQKLVDQVSQRINRFKKENFLLADASVPVDIVTASASGLDPHISPAAAYAQIDRVARSRHLASTEVEKLVTKQIENPLLGILGEPRVNVLELNLALDNGI